ncbi:hypothetical protein D3C74_435600 [compost metagenome]
MEYEQGNFKRTKRIIIELDNEGADIKKTGELFETIFDIAKKNVNIMDFSKTLTKKELGNGLFDRIVEIIDIKLLKEIVDNHSKVKKYKIT